MTSDGIERELELFSELLQQPPEDRDAFLEKRHGSHPEIMRRLKRLLAAHENAQRTDAETAPMIAPVHTPDSSGAGEHPSMIDRYRVLSVLGEGGMGVVYIAEQSQPVQRQVALKVIKPGMDCASVIKRFERERQTLAIMDHPNVAKVFDGGVIGEGHVGAGRPYFAMELVDGRPITEYCDQKRLSIEERLELFLGVCRGLEHAHQRGIIHRDIKPSNVLCTERDGEGAPVIIDFGVAKALESSVDHATQRTELGVIIGTPDYMSPEQADGDTNAIDTRSDVYSLGALLYELLCGRTVFDLARGGVSISRIREIVLTQEPMKPSTRFNELGESVEARAHHRAADPYVLRRKIHNDLDWVVLKALQKNPDARYPSARALADDLHRFLHNEPVLAAPPSKTYAILKFCTRHRIPVGAGLVALLSLIVGLTVAVWQAEVAKEQSTRAQFAESEAQTRLLEVQQIADFQGRIISGIDPFKAGRALSDQVTETALAQLQETGLSETDRQRAADSFVARWTQINTTDLASELIGRQILEPAQEEVSTKFENQPQIQARLLQSIGERNNALGRYLQAAEVMQEALDAVGPHAPENGSDVLKMRTLRAEYLLNASEFEGAAKELREVIALADRPETSGLLYRAQETLARVILRRMNAGEVSEAKALALAALEGHRAEHGTEDRRTIDSMSILANALIDSDEYDQAAEILQDVLAWRTEQLGKDDTRTLEAMSRLAGLAYEQQRFDDAVALYQQVVDARSRVVGEVHPSTVREAANLAEALSSAGRPDEGIAIGFQTLDRMRAGLGSDDPTALSLMNNLTVALTNQDRFEEAIEIGTECLERRLKVLGRNHPRTLVSYNVLGFVHRRQQKPGQARPYLTQALEISKVLFPEGHPDRLLYMLNMGSLERATGELDEAERLYSAVMEQSAQHLGLGHRISVAAFRSVVRVAQETGRQREVLDVIGPLTTDAVIFATASDSLQADMLVAMADAHVALEQFASAEKPLLDAYKLASQSSAEGDQDASKMAAISKRITDLYETLADGQPDSEFGKKAIEWRKRSLP